MKMELAIAVLLVVLQIAKCAEDADYLSEAMFCLQELNLVRGEMENVIGDENNDIPEDNSDFNEFAACYLERKGFLNPSGEMNYPVITEAIVERYGEGAVEKFNAKVLNDVIMSCKGVPAGNSKGQTAVKVFNCLTRKVKEYAK